MTCSARRGRSASEAVPTAGSGLPLVRDRAVTLAVLCPHP